MSTFFLPLCGMSSFFSYLIFLCFCRLQTIKKKCDRSKLKLSIISESAVSAEEEMKQMNELYLEDSRFANGLSQELEELRLKHRQANNDRQEKLMQEQTLNMEIGVSCFSCDIYFHLALLTLHEV